MHLLTSLLFFNGVRDYFLVGGTFVFFATAQTNAKKSKRATKPTHQNTVNKGQHNNDRQKASL